MKLDRHIECLTILIYKLVLKESLVKNLALFGQKLVHFHLHLAHLVRLCEHLGLVHNFDHLYEWCQILVEFALDFGKVEI